MISSYEPRSGHITRVTTNICSFEKFGAPFQCLPSEMAHKVESLHRCQVVSHDHNVKIHYYLSACIDVET